MFRRFLFLMAILSMLTATPASAKTMYITDLFRVTLRTGTSNEYKVIAMLKSNDEVELLEEQDSWARVRSKNGKEGYILSRFLTSNIPKPSIINRFQQRVENLEREINGLRKIKKNLGQSKLELESNLASREKELAKVKRDYEELKSDSTRYIELKELKGKLEIRNKDLENQTGSLIEENKHLKKQRDSLWFASGAGVLLIGWLLGLVMAHARISRRRNRIKVGL